MGYNKINGWELMSIIQRTTDSTKVSRKECFQLFKEKRMGISVSRYCKMMYKEVSMRESINDVKNRSDLIITQLKREWIINELI